MINSISMLYSFFYLFAFFSSLFVLAPLNHIYRILFLIGVFLCGSFIYTLLDFYFLGLTYIIVYVGAIAILFIFVIMMVQLNSSSDNTHSSPITAHYSSSIFHHHISLIPSTITWFFKPSKISTLNLPFLPSLFINTSSSPSHKFSSTFLLISSPIHLFPFSSKLSLIPLPFFIFTGLFTFFLFTTSITHFTFFYPHWFSLYTTFTDIQSFAFVLYFAYPFILILIAITLFAVMIAVLVISQSVFHLFASSIHHKDLIDLFDQLTKFSFILRSSIRTCYIKDLTNRDNNSSLNLRSFHQIYRFLSNDFDLLLCSFN